MGFLDKAKEMAEQNAEKLEGAVDKAGDLLDEKTGGKFADKVDKAQEFAKEHLHKEA